MSNIAYQSGNLGDAVAITNPAFTAPFAGVNTDYILRQDFMQRSAEFFPFPLNIQHPVFTDYILVEEPQIDDASGLIYKWTRTYAKVPETYTEPGGTYGYTYIGFQGANQTAGLVVVYQFSGRERFTFPVPVQITREFFLVGDVLDIDGNIVIPATYTTWEQIPTVNQQRYTLQLPAIQILDVDYITAAVSVVNATDPTREDYEALMATDAANQDSFSIVVETASPMRWLGNIFVRETKRVKAL